MRLRHRVRLQSNTPAQDASGHPVAAWSEYRHCVAEVLDVGGREFHRENKPVATVTSVVTIRHPREGTLPLPTHRVVFTERATTRTLEVVRVERMDGQQRYMRLHCVEVQE